MPKSFGNQNLSQKKTKPKMSSVVPEDDEYEVEELDVDPIMSMMPMSFGKQDMKRDLTASFAKTKRAVNGISGRADMQPEKPQPEVSVNSNPNQDDGDGDEDDDSDSDDTIGPMPAEAEAEDEEDEFPISHEIVLKDHAKVLYPFFLDITNVRR